MFNDNSIVEDLNIRKHDCLIVSIRDDNLLNNSRSLDNTVEFHLFENEPPPPPQKKEKRSLSDVDFNTTKFNEFL